MQPKYLNPLQKQSQQQIRTPKRYYNETSKSINEELYQLITNVRILEDHLMNEQKRKETLL